MPEIKIGSQLAETRGGDKKSQKNTEKFKEVENFIIQLTIMIVRNQEEFI